MNTMVFSPRQREERARVGLPGDNLERYMCATVWSPFYVSAGCLSASITKLHILSCKVRATHTLAMTETTLDASNMAAVWKEAINPNHTMNECHSPTLNVWRIIVASPTKSISFTRETQIGAGPQERNEIYAVAAVIHFVKEKNKTSPARHRYNSRSTTIIAGAPSG